MCEHFEHGKERSVEAAGDRIFELSGWGTDVTVSLRAGLGNRLTYRSGGDVREFFRDEVLVAESDIGTLATVVLESGAADEPPRRLTLVLPEVNAGGEEHFPVRAAAVQTTQRSLHGGPRPGPQHSYATITLEGTVSVGQAIGPQDECHAWSAVHDLRPPGATLIVTATCTFPTTGFEIELRRHEPQGTNPEDLLLDKVVREPSGVTGQAFTDVAVRYEEETDFGFRTVTILPDGPTIDVQRAV